MPIYALAGGAGAGEEDILSCCGICPILPLFILSVLLGAVRNSMWAAVLALVLSGFPFVILLILSTNYKSSEDGDVVSDQETGWKALAYFGVMATVAALTFLLVAGRRLQRMRSVPSANQKSEGAGGD